MPSAAPVAVPLTAPLTLPGVADLITGGGWSPLALGASLLAWWTADRADLITLSGSQVTSWRDVKNGYNVTQGTSSLRPLYSATSFNGAPGLTFDGVDDYLELASQPFPSGAASSEMWLVLSQDALAADATVRLPISYGGDTTPTRRGIQRQVGSGLNALSGVVGDGAGPQASNITSPEFFGRCLAAMRVGPTSFKSLLNTTEGPTVNTVPATGASRLRIGSISNTSPGFPWKGLFRDVVITSGLSTAQANKLQIFLLARRML